MNKLKATPTLLSACAVLLALNLVRGEPWAFGQVAQSGPESATLVTGSVHGTNVYRFWSDGTVDVSVVEHDVRLIRVNPNAGQTIRHTFILPHGPTQVIPPPTARPVSRP